MTWRTKPWFQNQTIATRTPWLQVNMTGCSSKTSWAPTTIYTHIKHATYDTYTVYSTFWSCTFWGPGPWKEHCTNIGPNVPFEVPIYGNSGTVLFRVLDFQGYIYVIPRIVWLVLIVGVALDSPKQYLGEGTFASILVGEVSCFRFIHWITYYILFFFWYDWIR